MNYPNITYRRGCNPCNKGKEYPKISYRPSFLRERVTSVTPEVIAPYDAPIFGMEQGQKGQIIKTYTPLGGIAELVDVKWETGLTSKGLPAVIFQAIPKAPVTPEERLQEFVIKRDPIDSAKELGYEVHKLSPKDVVDKGDYAEGYRYRIGTYPNIFMAKSEKEISDYLLKERVKPITPEVTATQQKLLDLLTEKPIHIDDIARQANLGIAQTASDMAMLIIQGRAKQVKGTMTYVKVAIPKAKSNPAAYQWRPEIEGHYKCTVCGEKYFFTWRQFLDAIKSGCPKCGGTLSQTGEPNPVAYPEVKYSTLKETQDKTKFILWDRQMQSSLGVFATREEAEAYADEHLISKWREWIEIREKPSYLKEPEPWSRFKMGDQVKSKVWTDVHGEHPWLTVKGIYTAEWIGLPKQELEVTDGIQTNRVFEDTIIAHQPSPSYLKEAIAETECQIIPPEYYDLLGWLGASVPDYSFAIEPGARERKVTEVLQKLKEGVARIHESALFRDFMLTMSKFHTYSISNQMLIALQRPTATRVKGFVGWKELGRYVKAGEKGIAILAPCLPPRILKCPLCEKTFTERELRTHLVEVHQREDISILIREAREEAEAVMQPTPTSFEVVHVFDIAQTGGKPLPEFEVPTLTGAYSEDLYNKLMRLAEKHGLTVSFDPEPRLDPSIKGTLLGKSIWVKPDEPEAQRLKTLGHELAHYFTEAVFFIPRADAEVIAESVAFVICAHFGFDSGIRSFPYVALWAKEKKVLEQNTASIRKIAGRIIEEVEK